MKLPCGLLRIWGCCLVAAVPGVTVSGQVLPPEYALLVDGAFEDISLLANEATGRASKRVHLIVGQRRVEHLAEIRPSLRAWFDQVRQREAELWTALNGLAVGHDAVFDEQQIDRIEQQAVARDRLAMTWVEEVVRSQVAGPIDHGSRFEFVRALSTALQQLCDERRDAWEGVIIEQLTQSGALPPDDSHEFADGFSELRQRLVSGWASDDVSQKAMSIGMTVFALIVGGLIMHGRYRRWSGHE